MATVMKMMKRLIKRTLSLFGLEERQVAFPVFRKSVYAQNGEDGVLEFILHKLPHTPRYIIDIGANDGIIGSNSRLLIERCGFAGLLIEPYQPMFEQLRTLYHDHQTIQLCEKAIGARTEDGTISWHGHVDHQPMPVQNVNDIFSSYHVPTEIGVLSIDIDGKDNEVLAAIDWQKYRPWIVIAEIDSSSHKNLQTQIDIMNHAGYHPFLHIGNVFYVRGDRAGELLFNWKIPLKGRFGFFLKNK